MTRNWKKTSIMLARSVQWSFPLHSSVLISKVIFCHFRILANFQHGHHNSWQLPGDVFYCPIAWCMLIQWHELGSKFHPGQTQCFFNEVIFEGLEWNFVFYLWEDENGKQLGKKLQTTETHTDQHTNTGSDRKKILPPSHRNECCITWRAFILATLHSPHSGSPLPTPRAS